MATTASFLPGIELGPGVWTDSYQLRFGFSRFSGPGGQNVNKVNTKTELRVSLSALHGMSDRAITRLRDQAKRKVTAQEEILLTADTERTQESNRRACLEKLRKMIVAAMVEPKVRKKVKVSKAAKRKRLDSKKKQGEKKKARSWRGE